jgi:cell wall assembly regulator SMI1
VSLERAFAEILAWVDRAVPGGRDALGLRPPAEPSALDAYEAELGVALPADLRALWLLHDGQDGEARWLPDRWLPVSASRAMRSDLLPFIVYEWLELVLEHDPRQRALVYHAHRVPLVASDLGDYYAHVDLAPGPAGARGQILLLTSECDFDVVATGVGELLDRYATLVSSGAPTYDEVWTALSAR